VQCVQFFTNIVHDVQKYFPQDDPDEYQKWC